MSRRLARLAALALFAAGALLPLAGCWFASDQVAGGDDYPNSVQTLGRTAAEESSDSTDWNVWKDAPATPPGVYDSTSVPDSVPEKDGALALRSVAAAGGDVAPDGLAPVLDPGAFVPGRDFPGAQRVVDTIAPDPLGGGRRTVRVQSAPLFTARDTTWSAPGPGGRREVRRVSGRLDLVAGGYRAFSFEDDDGDSVLAPRQGSASRARILIRNVSAAGRVEETLVRVAAGPDLDFNARRDNALLFAQTVVRVAQDTLLKRVLRPALADDSVVYDPRRDSNRVEVEQEVRLDDGSVEQVFYEAVVFPDSVRNYPRSYRRVLTTDAGVTETVLLGRDSLPDFAPGDTGRVRTVFQSSVAVDTLERSETVYRVHLADTAGRSAQNRLLRVDRAKTFRFGQRAALSYALKPPAPLADGGRPRAGEMTLRLALRPSGWIEFTGTAAPSGFIGSWVDSVGNGGSVHYDSVGALRAAPTALAAP